MYKNLVTTVIATLVAACFISPAVAQTTAQADWVNTGCVENTAQGADPARVIRDLASPGWRLMSTLGFGRGESDAQILAMDFLVQAVPGQLTQASSPHSVDKTP